MNSWWNQIVTAYRNQPTKVMVLAGMCTLGLLLWGRLLLSDPPRVATADPSDKNEAQIVSPAADTKAPATDLPELILNLQADSPRNLFRTRIPTQSEESASTGQQLLQEPDDTTSRAMIRQRAQQLSLQAIVLGHESRAVINGRTVRPGEAIDGFRLVKLYRRHVDLEMQGITVRIGLP